jgi:hypothetical protein
VREHEIRAANSAEAWRWAERARAVPDDDRSAGDEGVTPLGPSWWDVGQTAGGMVTGMATKKVTVTLDETQLERIRALVVAGSAPSVSGFVQHSVEVALDDVAGWGALLAEALRQSG